MSWLVRLKLFANKYLGGLLSDSSSSDDSDEILEFDPLTGQWELVDRMIQTRYEHAVSVTTFESGLCV